MNKADKPEPIDDKCVRCGRDSYGRIRCRNCEDARQQFLKGE